MALVVEDGTAKVDAESYISVADADTYHANRANTAWDSVDEKEAALRKATDYMVQMYRDAWKGIRMSAAQALDWPRGNVYATPALASTGGSYPYLVADDIVPEEVKRACAELALRAATAPLSPDLAKDIISQTVGPITTVYNASSPQQARYTAIDRMLRPYLATQGGVNSAVVRS